MKKKKTTTLLRYPGGKSRAVKYILPLFEGHKLVVSPFFGGGAIELALVNKGVRVVGYDSFSFLVDFWKTVLVTPDKLADKIVEYYPMTAAKFYELQKSIHNMSDRLSRAAAFYVLNRTSFSGATLSGGYTKGNPRFNEAGIKKVREFYAPTLTVEEADFSESLKLHEKDMKYLDPPYVIESQLYGIRGSTHKDFDHKGLANILHSQNKWILSYNKCDEVLELYKGFHMEIPKWAYGMSSEKTSNEIIIFSKDLRKG